MQSMRKVLNRLAAFLAIFILVIIGYYLYDRFRERSINERLAELIHEEDRRTLSSKLKGYLEDSDPEVRARAALAIGRIGGKDSGPLLYEKTREDVIDVAAAAGFAIGLTGQKEYAARLLDVAFDLPSAVGAMAVASAGRLADSSMTEAADLLVGYLDHPSPDVREAACLALCNAEAKSKTAELIEAVSDESDEIVRAAGLYTLARLEVAEVSSPFIEHLADPDPFVRSTCLRGLARSNSSQAFHYLTIALNDGDPNVVARAVSELGRKDEPDAGAALVKVLRREKDEKLVMELFAALQRLKYAGAIDEARELIDVGPPVNLTAAAARYLAVVQGDRAVNLIDSLSLGDDPYLRAACAEAYGLVGSGKVTPRLAHLFNDVDPLVRTAAFEVLVRLDTANVHFYIRQALADRDRVVTTSALELIKDARLALYLPRLNEMMSGGKELDVDLRRTLVQVAGAFLSHSPDDSDAVLILINGALDREYNVRREAALVYRDVLNEDRLDIAPPAPTRIGKGEIENAIERYAVNPSAVVTTSKGEFEMELYFDTAPLTVLSFVELVDDGFYEGLSFHRVVPDFVIQGGDPRGDGWGGPPYNIRCEYSSEPYRRGTVGIATSGKDTGGSQFFVTLSPQPHLEARYTVFGQVISGMHVVDRIVRGDLIELIVIVEEESR